MPPRKNLVDEPVIDPKSRRLTDFWGKRDPDDKATPSVSPFQSASRRSSTPNPTGTLRPPVPSMAGGTPSRTFGSSPKPSPSPRKYITEEDDDEGGKNLGEQMLNSRKRARGSTPSRAIPVALASKSRQASPSPTNHSLKEKTRSPPNKRRETGNLVSPTAETGEPPSNAFRRQPNLQQASRHTKTTSVSSVEEMLSKPPSDGTKPGSDLDAMETSSGHLSDAHMTSASSNSSLSSDEDTSADMAAIDTSRARLEEIRKKAQERLQAKSVKRSIPFQSFSLNTDESDEDNDELEKLVGKVPKQSPKQPPKQPALTKKAVTASVPDPFDGGSPLTPIDEPMEPAPRRNSARTSRANSVQPPEVPLVQKTRARSVQRTSTPPSNAIKSGKKKSVKRSATKSVDPPPASMPSSLASLLFDEPKSKKRLSDPARQLLLQSVERNINDLGGPLEEGAEDEGGKDTREVDHSVTEMALGEQEARRMHHLFARDRAAAVGSLHSRPFWDEQLSGEVGGMEMTFQLPELILPGSHSSPLLSVAASHETLHILVSSGLACSLPPDSLARALPWLFMTACNSRCPNNLAVACLSAIHTGLNKLSSLTSQSPITFMHIISCIADVGPLAEPLALLGASTVDINPPPNPLVRGQIVARIITVIQHISRSLLLPEPDKLVILLLLLYLEPSTSVDLRRDLASTVDSVLASVGSQPSYSEYLELAICKTVIATIDGFSLAEQHQVLDCLFGGQIWGRRFMRWIALGLLLPSEVEAVDWSRYLLPPPLAGLAALTDTTVSTDSPFRIWSGTDYDDLFYRVEIVGAILTDVQQYDKSAEDLDHILTNLDSIHGRIVDARAAFLDRTRVKDTLQRLKLRVHFQSQHKATHTTIASLLKR